MPGDVREPTLVEARRIKIMKALLEHPDTPRREMARLLDVNESTIRSVEARWCSEQPPALVPERRSGGGPKIIFCARWARRLVRLSQMQPFLSAGQLAQTLFDEDLASVMALPAGVI